MHRMVLLAFLCAAPSPAYVRYMTKAGVPMFRPDASAIQFLVHTSIQAGAPNAQGEVMITPDSDPASALTAATLTWNAVATSTARFVSLQMTSLGNDPGDGNHVITIEDTPENRSVTGSLLAVTLLAYNANGAVTDTDIIINPKATFSTNARGTFDLQAVITHELGHSLGANHSGIISAAMFQATFGFSPFTTVAEATTQATLSADDAAFVTEAYPAADAGAQFGTISGTVAMQDGKPVVGALIAALDPSTGASVGGFSSLTNGAFIIARVPPGNYLVYAHPLDGPVFPANLGVAPGAPANTTFRAAFFGGNDSPSAVTVAGGGSAAANIVVDPAPGALTIAFLGSGPADGSGWNYFPGASAVSAGTSVDLYLWGQGLDSGITSDQIRLLGPGVTIRPGTLKMIPDAATGGMTPLRFTVDIAPSSSRAVASIALIKGSDAAIYSGGLVLLPASSPPSFTAAGIVNAASFSTGGVAPGQIFTLFGSQVGPAALSKLILNAAGRVSTQLAATQVWFDGVAAPMIYATDGQLSAVAPYSVDGKSSTVVRVVNNGVESAPVAVPVVKSNPALFTIDSSGKGQAAILNQDTNVNSPFNPASIGDVVVLYGTGEGQTSPPGVDGQFATTAFPKPTLPVSVKIGGVSANVVYYGAAPSSLAGLFQLNVTVPAGVARGTAVPVTVTVGTATSPAGVTLALK